MSARRRPTIHVVEETATVTALELFFDLVFVFGLTQVTAFLAANPTPHGLLRGLLILGVLWWSWVGYAWLGNVVRADEGLARMAMFAAMATMFVVALTIPEAFDDMPGGLHGPVVFALGYFAFRILHLSLFLLASTDDPGLRRQVLKFTPSVLGGTALLLVASQLEGPAQTATWAAALLADYGGTMLAGASGWRLRSSRHFAERHGLILIVALGESIVAIGVGAAQLPISWPIVVASVFGLAVAGSMWWAYFDVVALVAERVLNRARGEEQARLARDSYSYLHLPMVAGIVLVALGMKKELEYVGDPVHHSLADPLSGLPLAALYGGTALYLLAHVAFRLRNLHTVNVQRIVMAAVLVALIPLAARVPALAALGLLTVLIVGLIAFEAVRFAETRDRVRHHEDVATSQFGHGPHPRGAKEDGPVDNGPVDSGAVDNGIGRNGEDRS
jgi:low temperature requirement protein LtrA